MGALLLAWLAQVAFPATARALAPQASAEIVRAKIAMSLSYDAPLECSVRADFEKALRSRFPQMDIQFVDDAELSLDVKLEFRASSTHGELRIVDDQGSTSRRSVDGRDCTSVVQALSLTAALALEETVAFAKVMDEAARNSEASTQQGPAKSKAAKPEDKTKALGKSTSTEAHSKERRTLPLGDLPSYWLGGGLYIANLVVPQSTVVGRVFLRHSVQFSDRFRPEWAVSVHYAPRDLLQPETAIGVGYWGASLLACPSRLRLSRVTSFLPCANAEYGRLAVTSRRASEPAMSNRGQLAVGPDGYLDFAVGSHLAFELMVGAMLPFVERRYVTQSPEQREGHTPQISLKLGASIAATW